MCCMRSADGPGAASSGKLLRTLLTVSKRISAAAGRECKLGQEGAGACGWSLCNSAIVVSSSGSTPLLNKAAHAFRSKPSRHRASALRRLSSGESLCGEDFCLRRTSSQSVPLSPASQQDRRSSVKAAAWNLCFFPPRGGDSSTHLGSMRSWTHASMLCVSFTSAIALVRAWAQSRRAFFGTCFSVRAGVFMMSSRVGRGSCMSTSSGTSADASGLACCEPLLLASRSSAAQVGWMPLPAATQHPHHLHCSRL